MTGCKEERCRLSVIDVIIYIFNQEVAKYTHSIKVTKNVISAIVMIAGCSN
jgi:hypothetical protein